MQHQRHTEQTFSTLGTQMWGQAFMHAWWYIFWYPRNVSAHGRLGKRGNCYCHCQWHETPAGPSTTQQKRSNICNKRSCHLSVSGQSDGWPDGWSPSCPVLQQIFNPSINTRRVCCTAKREFHKISESKMWLDRHETYHGDQEKTQTRMKSGPARRQQR